MRKSDLRIGNLVETRTLRKEWEVYRVFNGEDIDNADNLRGIPLTEDWLIELGFKKDKDNVFKKSIKAITEEVKELCVTKDWVYIGSSIEKVAGRPYESVVYVWSTLMRKDYYVHELQNLYYSLTHKELKIKG